MSDPQPLSLALAELIAVRGFARTRADDDLQIAWRTAAGELAQSTRAVKVARGVLSVEVTSTGVLSELVSFHASELTAKMQRQAPQLRIKSIKFRLK
ncbi:MAG: DUF721 domain-containing protein [Planctomycetaceae bacterium]|nr:DUF721 domain-containing protein [Planctomycetaceae bacterium]